MLLRKMTIYGFKSFAEKTTFDFSQKMTAIIGPNGCGKSNVIDAVRWVLGEQSVKTLRGGKMEDVIFSGCEKRKPLNFAEVSLFFDDVQQNLNFDYKEIQVTRRLYRSGESEYYINKSSCRLKDIHELFMDTGVGKEVYSIVGQNRVEEIVSAKPEERRELLEEAAGVLKYKTRKKEAWRRLEEMRANAQRVGDLIYELENQLGPVEKQAEVARQYQSLKKELREKEKLILSHRLHLQKDSLDQIYSKLSEVDREKLETSAQITQTDNTLEELKNEEQDLSEQKKNLEKKLNSFEYEKEQRESKINLLTEKINNIKRQQEDRSQKIRDLKSRKEVLKDELHNCQQKISESEDKLTETGQEISRLKDKKENIQNEDSLVNLENMQEELTAAISHQEVLASNLQEIEKQAQELEEKIARRKNESWKQEDKLEELENRIEDLKKQKEEKQNSLHKLEGEKRDNGSALQEIALKKEEINEKLNSVKEKLSSENNRLWLLKKMDYEKSSMEKGAESLLNNKENLSGLLSSLFTVIKASPEIKPALEAALGEKFFGVVAADENSAARAVEYLHQNQSGWANIIPISTYRENLKPDQKELSNIGNYPGVRGTAFDLVEVHESYEDLVRALLANVVVAEDLEFALKIARKFNYSIYAVTLKGEAVYPGGIIRGGEDEATRRWDVEAEIQQLEAKVEELQSEKKQLEIELGNKAKQEKELKDKDKNMQKQLGRIQGEMREVTQEISLQEKEREHAEENLDKLNESIEDFVAEKKELLHMKDKRSKELVEAKSNRSELENNLEKQREKYKHLLEEKNELSNLLSRQQIEYNKLDHEITNLREKVDKANREMEDINEKVEVLNKEWENANETLQELEEEKEKLQNNIEELAAENKEVSMSYEEIKKIFTEKQAEITEVEKNIQRLKNKLNRTEKKEHQLELERTRMQTEEEHHLSVFKEKFGEDFIPEEAPPDVNEDELENIIKEIQEKIDYLGPVRLGAIEEMERIQERLSFLCSQQEDLESGEYSLQQILSEIDERIKTQFQEALSEIAANFQETFYELFGGGEALLKLSDEEQVLDSGIDIIVQPPGKKLKNISLLSAGEKALTAIALLFAIFEFKPAPFYFLDEIESSLDDNNLIKFNEFMEKAAVKSQFILVTHRRRTMENADIVYGVTMPESGVSRLVSVKLDDDKRSTQSA